MTPNSRRYKVGYDVHIAERTGFTKAELRKSGLGGCDALFVGSIVRPADGGLSTMFMSFDPDTKGPLPPIEVFKLWSALAHQLAAMEGLDEGRQMFCELVFQIYRLGVLGETHIRKQLVDALALLNPDLAGAVPRGIESFIRWAQG